MNFYLKSINKTTTKNSSAHNSTLKKKKKIKKWAELNRHFSKEEIRIQQEYEKMLNITNHQGNANQKPQWDSTSHLSERLSSKRTQPTNADEHVE